MRFLESKNRGPKALTRILKAMMVVCVLLVLGTASTGKISASETDVGQINLQHPRGCPGICSVTSQSYAQPSVLLAGEPTKITIPILDHCPAPLPLVLRVMFLVDTNSEDSSGDLKEIQEAIGTITDEIWRHDEEIAELGLIQVDSRPRVLSPYTRNPERFASALKRLRSDDSNALHMGFLEARRQLGRVDQPDCQGGLNSNEIIITFSNGPTPEERGRASCEKALRARRHLTDSGTLSIAVFTGEEDHTCMRQIASSARDFYYLQNASGIAEMFARFRRLPAPSPFAQVNHDVFAPRINQVQVVETLAENVNYIPGSARPFGLVSDDGRQLVWNLSYMPRDGISLTYRVKPLHSGSQVVSQGTQLTWREYEGRLGSDVLAPARITVLGGARPEGDRP